MSDSSSSEDSPPRRRKRAAMFYKQYKYDDEDGTVCVPRTTSRRHDALMTPDDKHQPSTSGDETSGISTGQERPEPLSHHVSSSFSFEEEHIQQPASHSSSASSTAGAISELHQYMSRDSPDDEDVMEPQSASINDLMERNRSIPAAFNPNSALDTASVSENIEEECSSTPEHQEFIDLLSARAQLNVQCCSNFTNDVSANLDDHYSSDFSEDSDLPTSLVDSTESDNSIDSVDSDKTGDKTCKITLGNFEKLKQKYKLESPLIPNVVETSKFECLFMILNFSMQEGLSYKGTQKLLNLINSIFGIKVIPDGIDVFRSLFECDIGISYHFYCPKCFYYFGDSDKVKTSGLKCPVTGCGREGNLKNMNDGKFFIHLPLTPQIKIFLESKPNAKELLAYRFHRDQSENTIRDVFDGELYKALSSNGGILSDKNNISVTLSTDGSPIFSSVSNTMWPVQARINELPPNERFDSSNMFVCGIWFGSCEPNMNVFLAPYVMEARQLYEQGFKWQQQPNNIEVVSKVVTLNCCLDSRAKPDVQCFKQLHSYCGCSYCYHPGSLVNLKKNKLVEETDEDDDENGLDDLNADADLLFVPDDDSRERKKKEVKAVRFCVSNGESYPLRTDEEMRRDMVTSNNDNVVINGVIGISVLTMLPKFDIVNGFVIDYMHAVFSGVVRMLLRLWIDPKYSKQAYSIRGKLQEVNARLLKFTPPTNISRRPRSITDYLHWKANELRAWLYFYSVPCLEGILPDVYLKHFSLLVSAIAILSSECISEADLDQASRYLSIFVNDFELLYGPAFMVHNVHLLSHLCSSVKYSGPCWSHSAFAFETGNGVLVNLVKGTVGVMTQIANKYMTYRCTPLILRNFTVSIKVKEFCESLVPKRMSMFSSRTKNRITVLYENFSELSPQESKVLLEANMSCTDLTCYHRIILNNVVYDSKTYIKKGSRSNNSIVKTSDGNFSVITRIFIVSNTVYVILRNIKLDNIPIIRHESGATCRHIHVCALYPFSGCRIVKAKQIISKCVLLVYNSTHYVAEFPNMIEKD